MPCEKYIRYVLIIYSLLFIIVVHAQRISNLSTTLEVAAEFPADFISQIQFV